MNTFVKSSANVRFLASFILLMVALLNVGAGVATAQSGGVKNIVLVHGAFTDGSGWKPVYDILVKKGYHVSIVQNPLTSLQADVDATNSVIDRQEGKVVLVGHSWAGMVITEAGVNDKVAALVYISAFMPDKGETAGQWVAAAPASPAAGFTRPDKLGFVYFDSAKFHRGFAGDLSKATSDFMNASQVPIIGKCFDEPVEQVAWKSKPSYGIIATQDNALSPSTERAMYERACAGITEIKGSHVVFIAHAEAVAEVIMKAANNQQ